MANATLPSHIIELDDSVDNSENDFDPDLVALRIAASRAQEAAIRYEARTTSMKTSFSASFLETRDQSPPFDARDSRQRHERDQERNQERERSSCDEDGETLNPRTESPDLGSPHGHSDVNQVVQPRHQATADIFPTRTKSPVPSFETGEDRLSAVSVMTLERPHLREAAMSEPRPQPPSAGSTKAQKRRNRTSSPDVWMKKISRKKARKVEGVVPATKTPRLGRQSSPSHTEGSYSNNENHLLTTVFRTDIYPLIKTACSQHSSIRSHEQAHSVGRAVSTEVVNDEFRRQLRDSGYRLSDASRQKLRRAIHNLVNRKTAPPAGETSYSELTLAESSFGTVLPNPPGVGNHGTGEPSTGLCAGPELPRGTSRASVDLSLLGPGEISSKMPDLSTVVASTEKTQGLPLGSSIVEVPSWAIESHCSLPKPASPPKSKLLGAIPPTAVSLPEESGFPKPNTATRLDIKRSPDSAAAKRDNQKLWHCVCGKTYKTAGGLKSHRAHSVPCNNSLSLREAMTIGANQHERVSIVEKRVSLLPLLDESMTSGINTFAQPDRVGKSEHDVRTFSSSTAHMAGNARGDVLRDSGLLQSSDAGWCCRVQVERNTSESAASPLLLPPMGPFSPLRSSSASALSVSKALATSVSELNHDSVQGDEITHSELRSSSPTLRETQGHCEFEKIEAVGSYSSDKEAGTLLGTLYTDGVGSISVTQPSSAGGENTKRENGKRENTKGEHTKGQALARDRQDTPTVSSCAELKTLPSKVHLSPFESVTASNNNSIKTSTEVFPRHPEALAQILIENQTKRSSHTSQFAIPRRGSRKRCKSGVTTDQMAPTLRPRAPLNYYPAQESPSSETFDSLPLTPADGPTITEQQQYANNHTDQRAEKRADPQHVTPQREISRLLADRLSGSMSKLGTPRGKECPYLSLDVRRTKDIFAGRTMDLAMFEGDQNRILHMDFEEPEYEELVQAVYETIKSIEPLDTHLPARLRLMGLLKNIPPEDQLAIREYAHRNGLVLKRRNQNAIKSLFQDASKGQLPERSIMLRIRAVNRRTTASLLRNRQGIVFDSRFELSAKAINRVLRVRTSRRLATWKSWSDASNDVLVVAWSPNGSTYAVGASAQTDPASAQYNKRNNLLLGDLYSDTLRELPDHHIDRPIPEDGTDTQWALYNACDPILQTSVTATRFSVDGDRMYSASYDHTVKVWDVSQRGKPFVVATLKHDAEVELAATSSFYPDFLATGSRTREGSIRVYYSPDSDDAQGAAYNYHAFSSSRAKKHASEELYPSSLQWGTTSETSGLLLAGFSPKVKDDTEDCGQNGEVCLWDLGDGKAIKLAPSSQNVFDAVWHPNLPMFATGSTPLLSKRASRETRTVVRTYEPLRSSFSTVEYECPALDINDVTFAPHNGNYISAGCTDGITYVWDFRNPNEVMLQLQHGEPLAESHPDLTREQHDTGVRFAAWDGDGQYLYTGSSDGFIKQWDIRHAAEDTLIRDVAQLKGGVMCGAFSPDYSNLLVGDDTGAIQILSTAPTGQSQYTGEGGYENGDLIPEGIPFIYAPQNHRSTTAQDVSETDEEDLTCYGTMIADDAIATGELTMHPIFGAGKGPNYSGSYCLEARPEGTTEDDAETVALLPDEQAQQLARRQRRAARRQGCKAKKAEVEIIKEQVKLAWLRNVNVELSNRWGEKYIKESDDTLVKQFKEGKEIVQILKELKLQNSGARDADISDLNKGNNPSKHVKDEEDSEQDVIIHKKSKHRHSKPKTDSNNLFITHSSNPAIQAQYRQIGNVVILDSDSDTNSHTNNKASVTTTTTTTTPNLEKHYHPRDLWLPQEHNQILFEDAEDSFFPSRETEREQVMIEAEVEETKRRRERERMREMEVRALEERRKLEEARARLLRGG